MTSSKKSSFEKKFFKTIGKYKLIEKNDKVVVALSGTSSATMLFLLKQIKGMEIFAITIDEEKKKTRYSKNIAKKFGVNHIIVKGNSEIHRRYILNKTARELVATKLAVGHSMDDECASIILSMCRGDFSRFQRLGPNPIIIKNKKFVPRIKPMIFFSEKEILNYAKKKIPLFKEKKAKSHREDIKKMINKIEKFHPGTKNSMIKFYERLMPMIISKAIKKINYCERCGEPTSRAICRICEISQN
ncbi:MAG TPA: hypothetical protein VJB11_00440 [archaeon]|nr:hypothetical protein [archaeon]